MRSACKSIDFDSANLSCRCSEKKIHRSETDRGPDVNRHWTSRRRRARAASFTASVRAFLYEFRLSETGASPSSRRSRNFYEYIGEKKKKKYEKHSNANQSKRSRGPRPLGTADRCCLRSCVSFEREDSFARKQLETVCLRDGVTRRHGARWRVAVERDNNNTGASTRNDACTPMTPREKDG